MSKRKTISNLAIDSVPVENDVAIPTCSHGKALKFERIDKKTGSSREFYACSANRDRKLCPLFYWVDEWEKKLRRPGDQIQHSSISDFVPRAKQARPDVELGVATYTDDSANSQFLFDSPSIELISRLITTHMKSHASRGVLCIGTPTIHKFLMGKGIESVLLDEDVRLVDLLPKTSRFNMFNGESYGSQLPLDTFACIVIDPPFQPALLPALNSTLKTHFPKSLGGLLLLAFPYFNELQISASFENLLHMSDIRLTYRNHKKYISGTRSPVRLFSSAKIGTLVSNAPSYAFCNQCEDIKHESNSHCTICNSCTTKAGPRHYKHCSECNKCVKPDAKHDESLGRCVV